MFEGDSASAAVARATVASAGIESWVKDEGVHGIFPSLGPTEILVCEEDREAALKALETPEYCAPVVHSEGLSSSMPNPNDSGETSGNRGKGNYEMKVRQSERSGKGHRVKEHHRQSKGI